MLCNYRHNFHNPYRFARLYHCAWWTAQNTPDRTFNSLAIQINYTKTGTESQSLNNVLDQSVKYLKLTKKFYVYMVDKF